MSTGADIFELSVPQTPPSLNAAKLGSRGAHMRAHRLKKSWEGMLMIALLEQRVPKKLRRVHATAVCRFAQKRKRDEGNFRYLLEKALGDALQLGGHLADDTPEEFTFGALTFDPERGSARTLVTLEVWRP